MTDRPKIPEKVKRKVRQRCGFGCIICGLPIYQYDHLLGYAKVKRHEASELTLLCPNHHAEKTNGLLSDAQVERANKTPHNLKTGQSTAHLLHFEGDSPEILMGGSTFTCNDRRRPTVMIPVMVHKKSPFWFSLDSGHLLFNLVALDSKNNVVLEIRNSELVYSSAVWDATMVGRRFAIREGMGNFVVALEFRPPNCVVIEKYEFESGETHIDINDESVTIQGGGFPTFHLSGSGSGTICANVGILVGGSPKGLGVGIRIG